MYEIPSRADVKRCIVDADVIRGRGRPYLEVRPDRGAVEEKSA